MIICLGLSYSSKLLPEPQAGSTNSLLLRMGFHSLINNVLSLQTGIFGPVTQELSPAGLWSTVGSQKEQVGYQKPPNQSNNNKTKLSLCFTTLIEYSNYSVQIENTVFSYKCVIG